MAGGGAESLRGNRSSGGFEVLPGLRETESAYMWSPDCPYEDVPTTPLVLLGTERADLVRSHLKDLFLQADAAQPALEASHRRHEFDEELQRSAERLDGKLASWHDDRRGEGSLVERERERMEERFHPLSGQTDVTRVARSLARIGQANEDVFSSERAQSETAGLLTDLLAQVKSPAMHRLLADVGLALLDHSKEMPAEARRGLVSALAQPGADPEVHLAAATRLVTLGELSALPNVVEGLAHSNAEVRRAALGSLQVVTAVCHDREVVNAEGLVEALRAAGPRIALHGTLTSAAPRLEALLDDKDSVWLRTGAARVLADLAPHCDDKAIATLRGLVVDNGDQVPNGKGSQSPKNGEVRKAACEALGRFGPRARAAVPELRALRETAEIGEAAARALALIEATCVPVPNALTGV